MVCSYFYLSNWRVDVWAGVLGGVGAGVLSGVWAGVVSSISSIVVTVWVVWGVDVLVSWNLGLNVLVLVLDLWNFDDWGDDLWDGVGDLWGDENVSRGNSGQS